MKKLLAGLISVSVLLSIFAVAVAPGISKKAAAGVCIGPTCPNLSPESTLGPNPPDGWIDAASCTTVSGWASDADLNIPIAVHIYIDGKIAGGTLADIFRSDVGSHGWTFNIPPALVNDKSPHSVDAYAIDINGNGAIPIMLATGLPISNNPLLKGAPKTIGPCTKTCENGSIIAIAGVCTKTCANGSVVVETITCTKTCPNGSVIAEAATCTALPPPPPAAPRVPTLTIASKDCTAIVFTSQDPDSPATKLTFLVGRSLPVVLAPPDLVDAGFVNPGGTWTIPASEKNASPHSYYVLVTGVNSAGNPDGVNTTSSVLNIPICAAPPAPKVGCMDSSATNFDPDARVDNVNLCTYAPVICSDGPHPAPYTCPVISNPFVPPVPISAGSFNDIFTDACKNAEGKATVCVDRDILQANRCNSIFGTCGIIGKVVNLISILVGVAAVFMMILGGLKYVASAGDPTQAAAARRTVLFAVVGVVITILAQGIIRFVFNRL